MENPGRVGDETQLLGLTGAVDSHLIGAIRRTLLTFFAIIFYDPFFKNIAHKGGVKVSAFRARSLNLARDADMCWGHGASDRARKTETLIPP